jgi:hypothetical protein
MQLRYIDRHPPAGTQSTADKLPPPKPGPQMLYILYCLLEYTLHFNRKIQGFLSQLGVSGWGGTFGPPSRPTGVHHEAAFIVWPCIPDIVAKRSISHISRRALPKRVGSSVPVGVRVL